jgi:hypothetical protein
MTLRTYLANARTAPIKIVEANNAKYTVTSLLSGDVDGIFAKISHVPVGAPTPSH